MKRCTFQTHYGYAAIFDELFYIQFAVIILPVFQRGEGADTKNIKIFTHYGRGIFYMFNTVAAHDGFFFKFKRPPFTANIEHYWFHSQVLRGDLRAESCTHAWIKE